MERYHAFPEPQNRTTERFLLDDPTLGLYRPEIPGVTFEIAQPKKKNRQRTSVESDDEPRAEKRSRSDFIDDDVEVESDIEEDTLFEAETKSDREFIDEDNNDIDNGSLHHDFDQQNPPPEESDIPTIYPPNDYRRTPYTSPELNPTATGLFRE